MNALHVLRWIRKRFITRAIFFYFCGGTGAAYGSLVNEVKITSPLSFIHIDRAIDAFFGWPIEGLSGDLACIQSLVILGYLYAFLTWVFDRHANPVFASAVGGAACIQPLFSFQTSFISGFLGLVGVVGFAFLSHYLWRLNKIDYDPEMQEWRKFAGDDF